MSRLFNESQKREMAVRQKNLCHDCGDSLGENYEAHHVKPYSEGGETSLDNGILACSSCHKVRHSKAWSMLKKFRELHTSDRFMWQIRGLFKVCGRVLNGESVTSAEAVMAGGKTRFSVQAMMLVRELKNTSTTIIFVPSQSIRSGYIEEINLQETGAVVESRFPRNRQAQSMPTSDFIVVTYQEATKPSNVQFMISMFEKWKRSGWKFGMVADEVHHSSKSHLKTWSAIGEYEKHAEHSIVQTGTPFRSDENAIAILDYGVLNKPIINIKYDIKQALSCRNVRPVSFEWIDISDKATYKSKDGKVYEAYSLEEIPEEYQSGVVDKLMTPGTGTLWQAVSSSCVYTLEDRRKIPELAEAKCLLACPSGKEKDSSEKLVEMCGKAWTRYASQSPEVVHSDKPESHEAIQRFKNSASAKYIAAINMISEGTNIPWLMVLGVFRCIKSEMLFNQLVGRVMRTTCNGADYEFGRVILPRTHEHVRFARAFESANNQVLGTCQRCGQIRPCGCMPLERPPVTGDASDSRIVEAFCMSAGADGGTAVGETVTQAAVDTVEKGLRHIGLNQDAIKIAAVLSACQDLNLLELSASQRPPEIPQRANLELTLMGRRKKLAIHLRQPQEDTDRLFFNRVGIDHESDIHTMTRQQLLTSCGVLQEMVLDAIRNNSI
jgi:superfamily II DNA or RNA helicase